MSDQAFTRLVEQMRSTQRKYFRTRSQGDLNESKRLEKAVDQAVTDRLQQPSLFDRLEEQAEEAGIK